MVETLSGVFLCLHKTTIEGVLRVVGANGIEPILKPVLIAILLGEVFIGILVIECRKPLWQYTLTHLLPNVGSIFGIDIQTVMKQATIRQQIQRSGTKYAAEAISRSTQVI